MPDIFGGHERREERKARRHGRRLVRDGDVYTIDEEERGELDFELPERREEPPVEVQGEPWGWTKGPPYPRGWPGPEHSRGDPGPFDGSWERPGEDRQ